MIVIGYLIGRLNWRNDRFFGSLSFGVAFCLCLSGYSCRYRSMRVFRRRSPKATKTTVDWSNNIKQSQSESTQSYGKVVFLPEFLLLLLCFVNDSTYCVVVVQIPLSNHMALNATDWPSRNGTKTNIRFVSVQALWTPTNCTDFHDHLFLDNLIWFGEFVFSRFASRGVFWLSYLVDCSLFDHSNDVASQRNASVIISICYQSKWEGEKVIISVPRSFSSSPNVAPCTRCKLTRAITTKQACGRKEFNWCLSYIRWYMYIMCIIPLR